MSGDTEVIETMYGEVEADVVECSSCGNLVLEEDAKEFTLGDREGWACSICYDTGPADYPLAERRTSTEFFGITMMAVLFPLSAWITAREASEKGKFVFFTGAVGATIWTLGILALLGVFDGMIQGGMVPL